VSFTLISNSNLLTAGLSGFLLGASLIIAIGAQNAFILRQGLLRQHVFILCLITLGDSRKEVNLLINALTRMSAAFESEAAVKETEVTLPEIPGLAMSPRDAFYAETETVKLAEAAGRISAEFVMVYPPGIPIFIPGEIIAQDNIDYIAMNIEAGLPVQGPEDDTLETIHVIKETKAIY